MADADSEDSSALVAAVRRPSGSHRFVSMKVLIRVLAAVLVLLLILTLLGVFIMRRSFPTTDGDMSLPGLDAEVSVTRDESGVPTVEASTSHDLFMAQGFVHAQDRFWEMDFRRHVTSGRLSELFGESQFGTDSFIRTLGWRKVAEAEVAALDDKTRAYYEAYAEGVNAYLHDKSPTEVSLEYGIVGLQNGGVEIEEWTPVDSVSWLKAMAWDLRSNVEDEIDRAISTTGLDDEQMADIYPDYPYDTRPTITGGNAGAKAPATSRKSGAGKPGGSTAGGGDAPGDNSSEDEARAGGEVTGVNAPRTDAEVDGQTPGNLGELKQQLKSLPTLLGVNSHDIGSNSWVVSGEHTATGAPLLANDPHLSPSMPSVWHQIGLRCTEITPECPFDVSGFSFSGLPGVVIGHNQNIAWGLTNLGPDVADLVVERIRDGEAVRDTGDEAVTTRKETVKIAKQEPREITIRSTSNGPLISDLEGPYRGVLDAATGADTSDTKSGPAEEHYQLALQWTALQPGNTASAIFGLNAARNWGEFRQAASLFDAPSQNLIYADTAGNIGYQAPGKIPKRGKGDGMLPRHGWKTDENWQGYLDFKDLPSLYNPERGWIVTANNPVTPPGDSVQLSNDFDDGDRARRITKLVQDTIADGDVTTDDMSRIQGDDLNPLALTLIPLLEDLEAEEGSDIAEAQELLSSWDGRDDANSAAAAYFNVLTKTILDEVFAPKLPDAVPPGGGSRWYLIIKNQLKDPDSDWWADSEVDDRDEALTRAMDSAWETTEDLLGSEPVTWRWGILHRLTIRNASLGESGIKPIEQLFNRGPYEVAGGSGEVNATGWDASVGFETNWVPSMRQIIDLKDFNHSQWINLTGASGHAFHPHYADQTEDWAANKTRPWPYTPDALDRHTEDTLVLRP
ncbi:penicillin acylase family protein [Brevibacterium aurantiacum]|uniref:Penicillin acylase family protein n=1 Tax=Brevibacterium aurantiacum TaxID=273384 RepID=A0A2A3ZW27_BREAU|nr:penicillin acylase family protein [Brevibacterium aurantiacum]PCC55573.1 penicillin acylase family protein [Brevibacterium aurantiacum]